MNEQGKSYGRVVPKKRANKGDGAPTPAEHVEERRPAKGNSRQQNSGRAQKRETLQSALERVRQVARSDKEVRFTTLWHHVYNIDRLREAYLDLERNSAAGVDGETWQSYQENLEGNLTDLSERLKRGAYRARPVRRMYIPKADGRQRPIGVPALEDKIVQRATAEVLNAVYEVDFLGFSYGFRPVRSQHNALDAVTVGIEHSKLKAIRVELKRRMHHSVVEVGRWLGTVTRGYYRYHAVPRNYRALATMRHKVIRYWRWVLDRRSQRSRITQERMKRLAAKWLPQRRILHPYPDQRLRV